jgi:hypothetical protein
MSTATAFRSRWGFHPCDYATFRKLKFLNMVFLRAIRMDHAWKRWKRKAPQNRVRRCRLRDDQGRPIGYTDPVPLTEPPLCSLFSHKVEVKRFVDSMGTIVKEGFLDETVVTEDGGIAMDYSAARKPRLDPNGVRPLRCTSAEIDARYEQARAWLEQQDIG